MADSKYVQGLAGLQAVQAEGLVNKKWIIKSHILGKIELDNFELVEELVDTSADVPAGKVLVKVEMLSIDAFLKTMLEPGAFHGTAAEGTICPALGYGTVIKSGEGTVPVGTRIQGRVNAQTVALLNFDATRQNGVGPLAEVDGFGPEANLGLFGLTTGLTAYGGVFFCLNPPQEGETVVVSAAAGATGNIAAQLCKSTGAKVIGIAGGKQKCDWLREELQLDGAIDYKDGTTSVGEQLDKLCPDGINFFFDNVGGEILDDVLLRITQKARIIICGGISQYSRDPSLPVRGPTNYLKLAERNSTMKGFVVTEFIAQFGEAKEAMKKLHEEGKLKAFDTKHSGIEKYPTALEGLFTGTSMGKTLVDLAA